MANKAINMDLKEKIISSFYAYGDQLDSSLPKMEQIRVNAIENFEKKGFPSKKDEDWKYTSLNRVLKNNYALFFDNESALEYRDVKQYFIHDIESYKLVFVDGKYSSHLSETTHDGCDICIMSSAFGNPEHHEVVSKHYNTVAPETDSLVSLNTAFATEGGFVYLPKNMQITKPIQILHFISKPLASEVMLNPRNMIVLDKGAKATVIERVQCLNPMPVLTNSVTEIKLGKGAELDYYKIQNDQPGSSLLDHTFVEQQRDSIAKVFTFSFGGDITRNNLNFYHKGENIESHLTGLTLLDNNQLVDHHTLVEHAQPHCNSYELYKGLFDGTSKGVFNGKIKVHKEAQKTNAFQQNNNVLISDKSTVDTKPQLEIFADDVKCTHGCTVGQLDETALFYMQTRGIPLASAKAMLMVAFANETLEKVSLKAVKNRIYKLIAKKLNVDIEFDF